MPDLGSDHLGLQITIDLEKPLQQTIVERYNFHKTNLDEVNKDILDYLATTEGQEISPGTISRFNQNITNAILRHTPKCTYNFYTHQLPPFILCLIKKNGKIYREYRITRDPQAKSELNQLIKHIETLIQQFRTHKWLKTCEEINEKRGKT
ncbi:hypothetical protein JTB14_016540 [Gonioctena quinquepunctata]|nr:hypothetical protein JTB14_016540 [Gonioctena quinquepunctata]